MYPSQQKQKIPVTRWKDEIFTRHENLKRWWVSPLQHYTRRHNSHRVGVSFWLLIAGYKRLAYLQSTPVNVVTRVGGSIVSVLLKVSPSEVVQLLLGLASSQPSETKDDVLYERSYPVPHSDSLICWQSFRHNKLLLRFYYADRIIIMNTWSA